MPDDLQKRGFREGPEILRERNGNEPVTGFEEIPDHESTGHHPGVRREKKARGREPIRYHDRFIRRPAVLEKPLSPEAGCLHNAFRILSEI